MIEQSTTRNWNLQQKKTYQFLWEMWVNFKQNKQNDNFLTTFHTITLMICSRLIKTDDFSPEYLDRYWTGFKLKNNGYVNVWALFSGKLTRDVPSTYL